MTINTGWTPSIPARTVPPATRPQLMALLAFVMRKHGARPAGRKAIAALDNAIDCLDVLGEIEEAEADAAITHEVAALEKMRAEFLATDDEYLHLRAKRITEQIESVLGVTG